MKYWILPDNSNPGQYAVVGASKRPKQALCEAPEGATTSDGRYISVSEVDGKQVATLDQAQKDSYESAQAAVKAAVQYKELRRSEYPPIGDQLDAIYKRDHLGDSADWDAIVVQIEAVKAKYPKPE